MLNMVGLTNSERMICKQFRNFFEICFVTTDFAHQTVAQRPKIMIIKKLATAHIILRVLDMKSIYMR
jgi:hypothetical protein